jgi:prepilin-type N-terminal cleavage/methylation domain-containing protein
VKREAGFSLVEVLVAALIIGIALVPLMQLFPGLLEEGQTDETTMRLGTVAVRQMESLITSLRSNIGSVASGSAACADLPRCWLVWTSTTEASSATQGVGSLVDLSVTACVDSNGNGACDAGETQVRYDAKVTSRP